MEENLIEEWFLKYEKDITSFLIYYTGSSEVEDLVQETFVTALNKVSKFKEQSNPKTWLISIARNIFIDRYRRKKVWKRIKHLLIMEQNFSNPLEEQMIRRIDCGYLYKAVNQLSSKQKEVIILRGIFELSTKETGQILNVNDNKVNVTFHRALKKLKTLLEKEDVNDERFTSDTGKAKGTS